MHCFQLVLDSRTRYEVTAKYSIGPAQYIASQIAAVLVTPIFLPEYQMNSSILLGGDWFIFLILANCCSRGGVKCPGLKTLTIIMVCRCLVRWGGVCCQFAQPVLRFSGYYSGRHAIIYDEH